MSRTVLFAVFLSLGAPSLAVAAPIHSVPQTRATPLQANSESQQTIMPGNDGLNLTIYGGTARWSFQLVCLGARCQFRHAHVPHSLREPEHVNVTVRLNPGHTAEPHLNVAMRQDHL